MGTLKPCLSMAGDSVEVAVIDLYDEVQARLTPGFDDVLREPFFVDTDDDGVGEVVKPVTRVSVKAKAAWNKNEEQEQTQAGNDFTSLLTLTVGSYELSSKGLLTDGVPAIHVNDVLVRIETRSGAIRVDFSHGGRTGLHCIEVRPGDTGTGIWKIVFEARREAVR